MKYLVLRPEVAGGLGSGTVLDTSVHPPIVTHLHYEVTGWLGDELLKTFPVYIISALLKSKLSESDLTGYEFDILKMTKSREYKLSLARRPRESPAGFHWLKVTGERGIDDFGLTELAEMIVSERAWELIKTCNVSHCEVKDFDTNEELPAV